MSKCRHCRCEPGRSESAGSVLGEEAEEQISGRIARDRGDDLNGSIVGIRIRVVISDPVKGQPGDVSARSIGRKAKIMVPPLPAIATDPPVSTLWNGKIQSKEGGLRIVAVKLPDQGAIAAFVRLDAKSCQTLRS